MTVAELIEKLQAMPPTATVLSWGWQSDQVAEVESVDLDRFTYNGMTGAWKYSLSGDVVVTIG